jgi:putative PIN family toxin of toxin-antitoxin system
MNETHPPVRIVLDANIFVSALIQPAGPSDEIVRRIAREDGLQIILTDAILDELRRCLAYPRLARQLRMSRTEIEEFLVALEILAEKVDVAGQKADVVCRDPKDEEYLVAAVVGRADYLVAGDADLLVLKTIRHISILRPRDFLNRMAALKIT